MSEVKSAPVGVEGEKAQALYQRYMEFPDISFAEYRALPEDMRKYIVSLNRILQTDTYNRTMGHIKGDKWNVPETYTLQMRRAPEGYLIVHGIRAQIAKITRMPITEAEFRFAKEFYDHEANVPFFNEEMWRTVIDEHGGYLPLEIDCVPDGTAILPGDPVLRVTGPGELAAHFEPDMHRVFYESLVATTAHEIATKIGAHRFIEVGKRGTFNEEMHLQAAVAMVVGGGITRTSNDAAVACYKELRDVGTLGHRFIQFYSNEEEAFREAIENTDATSLLIDLVDSMEGIETALRLKQEYRHTGKKIWIRLDSGDITAQTLHALKRYQEMGFTDPVMDKIVVEDISTVDDMVEIDRKISEAGFDPEKFVLYGGGGLLVTKMKSRSVASTGYKLSMADGIDKVKFSDSPGKESLPGKPTIVTTPDGHRLIAKKDEIEGARDHFVPAYRPGQMLLPEDLEEERERVARTFKEIKPMIGRKTPKSIGILESTQALADHYGAILKAGHTKARTDKPASYPERFSVPPNVSDWDFAYPEYDPTEFTHQTVFDHEDSWADAPDSTGIDFSERTTYENKGKLLFDEKGRPRNPRGRTGMEGRGLLGKWGPNHAADPVITRINKMTGQMELLVILRGDGGGWALPGGMVEDGQTARETVKRELREEAIAELLPLEDAEEVYRGYSDDHRNTDNAWMETVALHKHLTIDEGDRLKLESGDDAVDVRWMPLNIKNVYEVLYANHGLFIKKALERFKEKNFANLPTAVRGQIDEILFFKR